MTHVLIVEDQEENRSLHKMLLQVNGYRVTVAGDGLEALGAARRDPPDAIVSDVLMPKMDGFALCRAWMQDARLNTIPFIFYSGSSVQPEDEQFAAALGAVRFLVKPLEAEVFLRELCAVLQQWAGRAAPVPAAPLDDTTFHALHESALGRAIEGKIAELEAVNRELKASEARFRSLTALSFDLYWEQDDQFRFTSMQGTRAHLGTVTAILGQKRWERNYINMTAADWAGHMATLEAHRPFKDLELCRLDESGNPVWNSVSGEPVFDKSGAFKGYRGVGADITERKRGEEALRRFGTAMDAVADAIYLVDRSSMRFVHINDAACRMQGKTREELLALGPEGVLSPSRAELERIYDDVIAGGVATEPMETLRPRKDGSQAWVELRRHAQRSGDRWTIVTLVRDVTERRKAEEALKLFRALIDRSSDGIEVVDPETRRFIDVNDRTCRDLGYSREELLTMSVFDVDATVRRSDMDLHDDQLRDSGHATFETIYRRKDGSTFPAEINMAHVMLDRPYQIVVARDITQRKQAERELVDSESRFRGLVEQSIAGIYIIQEGKLAYVNPRFVQILGYDSAEELIGRDAVEMIAEKDRATILADRRRLIEGETYSFSYTFAALKKDGASVEVGVHGTPATHRGQPAIIGLLQDISEKKRAEEEIQRYVEQLKIAFMSTVEVATIISEMRDPYTAGHARQVGEIAVAIGAELGFDARRQEGLQVAGHLHDIGKITIPSEILSKPGKLTAIEFRLIQGHAQAGYDVLKGVKFPWPVAQVALQHHERMDGSGYPQGLKGEAILIEARIMAVADVVEAMSSHRPYRPGLGTERALAEIERGRGTAYDADAVDACLRLFRDKNFRLPV